ncbi:unnamed protein product [Brassica rapa]|uniref:DUF4408 domain-containing protein n=1 Tax=Brassica campestris TaxID=3711 RepID=A0A3P5Z6Z0_BRACM|nr:unnamed protein product [Brassica rapa]VDC75787.1 unnamed protein product [Brassica rapa]
MSFIDFDSVKAEKAKALHRFHSIGFLFRITEICVALLLLCWIFTSLPFAVQISGEFLRRISYVVSTPLFMFVLGNFIVVALLTTKSTVFSAASTIDGGAEADIYDAFIRTGDDRANSSDIGDLTEEIIVYDDKQIINTETDSNSNPTAGREDHAHIEPEKKSVSVADSPKDHPLTKVYRRSKSEISAKQCPVTVSKPLLRRSETEKCREIVEACEDVPFPEDNLTNEEFQKTIEAFIAKQLIFRRRESLAVVIHNQK